MSSIAIIKIDVEGAELEVLEGLDSHIAAARPVILMEILPCYKIENTFRFERQSKIEKILSRLDYKILRIHKNGDRLSNFEQLATVGIHSNMGWCDYVMAPSELVSTIAS